MKLRLLVGLSNGKQPGDMIECDADEAGRMMGARFAVPWTEEAIERAVQVPPLETRAKSKSASRRTGSKPKGRGK